MKAKELSKNAIVLAAAWVSVFFITKAFAPVIWNGKTLDVTAAEILASGGFFVIICTPLYRSIWLDKKLGIKKTGGDLCGTEK